MDHLFEGWLVAPYCPQAIEGRGTGPAWAAEVSRWQRRDGQPAAAARAPVAPQGLEPTPAGQAEPQDQRTGTLLALAAETDRREDEIQERRKQASCDGPGVHA